jgi:DNA-directed RNA polymerase subunit RPC12/RpoP
MSVRKSGKKKKRPPTPAWRCPKCGATVNLTVSERDNDSRCGVCGFKPYDWHLPDMPPLVDDVILPSKTNPEAEKLAKAAKEIGFNDDDAAIGVSSRNGKNRTLRPSKGSFD